MAVIVACCYRRVFGVGFCVPGLRRFAFLPKGQRKSPPPRHRPPTTTTTYCCSRRSAPSGRTRRAGRWPRRRSAPPCSCGSLAVRKVGETMGNGLLDCRSLFNADCWTATPAPPPKPIRLDEAPAPRAHRTAGVSPSAANSPDRRPATASSSRSDSPRCASQRAPMRLRLHALCFVCLHVVVDVSRGACCGAGVQGAGVH